MQNFRYSVLKYYASDFVHLLIDSERNTSELKQHRVLKHVEEQ